MRFEKERPTNVRRPLRLPRPDFRPLAMSEAAFDEDVRLMEAADAMKRSVRRR